MFGFKGFWVCKQICLLCLGYAHVNEICLGSTACLQPLSRCPSDRTKRISVVFSRFWITNAHSYCDNIGSRCQILSRNITVAQYATSKLVGYDSQWHSCMIMRISSIDQAVPPKRLATFPMHTPVTSLFSICKYKLYKVGIRTQVSLQILKYKCYLSNHINNFFYNEVRQR